MIERQPGRPSESEVMGAALRYVRNTYRDDTVMISYNVQSPSFVAKSSKTRDVAILLREQDAEGQPGEHESLREFAARVIAIYQKKNNI